jgi:hypothetical protein
MDTIEFVFGCRSTEYKSSWDKAFFICKLRSESSIISVYFESGMDYTGILDTYDEAFAEYNKYINAGWVSLDLGKRYLAEF